MSTTRLGLIFGLLLVVTVPSTGSGDEKRATVELLGPAASYLLPADGDGNSSHNPPAPARLSMQDQHPGLPFAAADRPHGGVTRR